jgi:putative hydrolase of the HAD superfamily
MSPVAIGFDLDDTLVVPDRDREAILREAVERAAAPEISREEYLRAHNGDLASRTRAPIFEAILDDYETDVSAAALAAAYREGIEDALVPVDGAADLVGSLTDDYRVGLLTDGPVEAQRGKLDALGWTDLFDSVVVTGRLPAGKPDGRAFERLLAELDAPADRTVYVGDHPEFDVTGAADAGLRTVQVVATGERPHSRADAHVERERLAADLPDVVAGLV